MIELWASWWKTCSRLDGLLVRSTSGTCSEQYPEIRSINLTRVRGAAGSKGRTSWSGRPELDDYTSFAGFFMHYVSYLRASPTPRDIFTREQSSHAPRATRSDPACAQNGQSPIVILGGYSYGSLILRHLAPVSTMLQPFTTPFAGSAHHEIIMRAHKLADQSNVTWINLAQRQERELSSHRSHDTKSSVTMGGEETSPDKRRTSRDIRRSVDGRLSADVGNRLRSLSHRRRKGEGPITSLEKEDHVAIHIPEVRYLLLSPLTPPISTLAAPALGPKFWHRSKESEQDVVGRHATLVVYGDEDTFTSARKLRDWCAQMSSMPEAQFSSVEVAGAGHFWVESGVERTLRAALSEWAASML